MAATTVVVAPAGTGSRGSTAGSTARPAVAASTSAASTVRCRGAPLAGSPGHRVRTAQARVAPKSATANVSSGAPPIAAQPLVGAVAWLIAILPQGKPPHGQRSLNASSAIHAYQATLSTHASNGKKKAIPKTSPTANEARSDRPDSAIASSAGPAAASGQIPAGGNAAASARPPASPAASAQRNRSGGLACRAAAGAVPAPASAWAGITSAG